LFDAANRRDLDAAAVFVDQAFVGEVPSDMSIEPDVYEGPDGLRRYLQLHRGQRAVAQRQAHTATRAPRPRRRAHVGRFRFLTLGVSLH
jgi:hypothetical protein